MINRKFWRIAVRAGLLASVFLGVALQTSTPKVLAAFGDPPIYRGYFKSGHPFLGPNGYQNVIGPGITNTTSKTTFENDILAIHNSGKDTETNSGYPTQGYALGADFIIQTMRGGSPTDKGRPSAADIADWKARLSNPDISIRSGNYCNSWDGNDYNSGYLNGDIAWVNQSQCGLTLTFYNNKTGVNYYRIRVDCANPLGTTGGLPTYNPMPNPPTGSLTLTCTAGGQATIHIHDFDGPTTGYITINGGPPSASHGDGYTYNISSATSWSSAYIRLYVRDVGPGASGYREVAAGPKGPCASATCGTQSLGTSLSVGVPVTFTVSVHYTGAVPPPSSTFAISITGSAGAITYLPPSNPATVGSGLIKSNPQTYTPTAAGDYTVHWSYGSVPPCADTNFGGPGGCGAGPCGPGCLTGCTGITGYNPYLSVLGGDLAAGPGFCNTTTTTDKNASILGKNTNGNPPGTYAGAGSQLAAIALLNINSFATSQATSTQSSLGGSSTPSALAFANTAPVAPTYGGNFYSAAYAGAQPAGTNYWCVPDYYSLATPNGALPSFAATGTYTLGAGTLTAHTIQPKQYLTLVVNGDLYINGNIDYSYSSLTDIPRFTVIVRGSIKIDPSVTHLSGIYIAQDDGSHTKGKVYTCANAGGQIKDYTLCGNQLTIDGAVSAARIIPGRTFGNLVAVPGTPGLPAETFQFSPELWLAGIHDPASVGGSINSGSWQSITSLPPVL